MLAFIRSFIFFNIKYEHSITLRKNCFVRINMFSADIERCHKLHNTSAHTGGSRPVFPHESLDNIDWGLME